MKPSIDYRAYTRMGAEVLEAEEPTELATCQPWPVLPDDALYGLAGDVVRTIAPHTEADPSGLLIQFKQYFGSVVGRAAYFSAEASRHYTNEYVVIAGQ